MIVWKGWEQWYRLRSRGTGTSGGFRTFLREGRETSRVSRWGGASSFGTLDEIYVGGLIAVANLVGND
jgi:hypothetical protein